MVDVVGRFFEVEVRDGTCGGRDRCGDRRGDRGGLAAVWLLHALIGVFAYLLVGAAVIGGGLYLYGRAKRSLAPGTRNQRRIEAAVKTYRMRNQ
jgi:hypothetical protein